MPFASCESATGPIEFLLPKETHYRFFRFQLFYFFHSASLQTSSVPKGILLTLQICRWIIERFTREKRCLKLNWMLQKRRYLVLTETELYWTKTKSWLFFIDNFLRIFFYFPRDVSAEQPIGRLILSEVNLIEPVDETTFGGKNIFRIASASNAIFLQASNGVDMTDWWVVVVFFLNSKTCLRLESDTINVELNQLSV